MRPLIKAAPPAAAAIFEADRLMSAIGPYCSLCEVPLHAQPSIWDSGADRIRARVEEDRWQELLVLCSDCAYWQRHSRGDGSELMLPHHATTFRVEGDSPYVYTRERVTLRVIDESGGVESSETDAAIVGGTTAAAANTVRRFRLNTPYYDDAAKTMTVPRSAYLSLADRRVTLRTEAWKRAEALAEIAASWRDEPRLARAFEGLRHVIEQTGFWSVWLTVFWRAFPQSEVLAPLFTPDRAPRSRRPLPPGAAALPPETASTLLRGTAPGVLKMR
ncbi:MAG TPA: hypothetical protein VF824_15875 [Thermoanaerobaculia bacterium]|jgi:hypothetical protein